MPEKWPEAVSGKEDRDSDGNGLCSSGLWKHLAIDDFRDRHFAARLRSGHIYSRSTAQCHYWHSRLSLYCMGVSLTVVHKPSFPALVLRGFLPSKTRSRQWSIAISL